MRKVSVFLFFLLFSFKSAAASVPIDIDLNEGGVIIYVGLDGENVVDDEDCGRMIQLALYDNDLPRTVAGTECLFLNPYYNFPWNPVQACDGCDPPHMSQIIDGSDSSYIKVRPILWIGNGVAGDFVIEQRITQTEFSNALKVSYKIIHEGSDLHKKLQVELPATWIKNRFSKFVYYNGNHPWTNDTLKETTRGLDYTSEPLMGIENWGALVNPADNRGIGVYNPYSQNLMNFWPNPGGGSYPRYFTTWLSIGFPPRSEVSLDIYILTGSVNEIRNTVYQLPRNTDYLVTPTGIVPSEAIAGEVIQVPVKLTNRTLSTFHKNPNRPDYDLTIVAVKRRRYEGVSIGDSDWTQIPSDVLPGQSVDFNVPVRMPSVGGKYVFEFDVLNEWWLVDAGFPRYQFTVDVRGGLGKGWNYLGSRRADVVAEECTSSLLSLGRWVVGGTTGGNIYYRCF